MARRICPNEHVVKDRKALKCPQCGADLPALPKRKKWPIVVGILGVLVVCAIAASIAGNGEESTSGTATRLPAATATPKPTPTPKPIADIVFVEVRDKRAAMTDAQWDNYRKPLIGQRVEWVGWVSDVDDKGSRGKILVDMDPPDTFLSTFDVSFYIPKEEVLKYNKDQEITFQGDIDSITDILGSLLVSLEDVTVIE